MSTRKRILQSSTLFAAVISTLLAFTVGIIGNSVYAFFALIWDQISTSIKMSVWPWFIILAILLISLGVIFYLRLQSRVLSQALTTANNLIQSDDTLLSLLAVSVSTKDHETEIKRLLTELLRDAVMEFNGDVRRASILLPNTEGEYLEVWAHYQMPEDSIARTRFYIGSNVNRKREQGVAGEAFLKGEIVVAHMKIENGQYKCDKDSFIDFDGRHPSSPYRSFICVPIIGLAFSGENVVACLGITCFDSTNPTAFDSSGSQKVLKLFARRIAAALLIYRQLSVQSKERAS